MDTYRDSLQTLPPIDPRAHKYTRGSLLVVAGSRRYTGAGVLATLAAERVGAGYVSLATPASAAVVARAHLLTAPVIEAAEAEAEAKTQAGCGEAESAGECERAGVGPGIGAGAGASECEGAPATSHPGSGSFAADALPGILEQAHHLDAVCCGPGLTITEGTTALVGALLKEAARRRLPLLLDADALGILAGAPHLPAAPAAPNAPTTPIAPITSATQDTLSLPHALDPATLVLTPHAGELARLCTAFNAQDACALAKKLNATIVAKGPETLITNGTQHHELAEASCALATAGTGDVLAGVIAGLLAQGMSALDAAVLGVRIHSCAGRLAEQHLGTRCVRATDVIDALHQAVAAFEVA